MSLRGACKKVTRSSSITLSWANQATDFLRSRDPVLARIITEVGPLVIAHRRERFQALVRAIIFQQLAGRAALAIYQRFTRIIGGSRFPTPAQVIAASDDDMRRAGLSRGKMSYICDLARHVRDGKLNFHKFARMDDEEIIAELVRVHGIGRWTAEMFLMFNLRRPDILPVDDLGFRSAVAKAYGLKELPPAKELRLMGERWRPYRSAAVWYFWQSTRLVTPDAPAKAAPKVRPVKRKVKPKPNTRVDRVIPANTNDKPMRPRSVKRRARRPRIKG
jgi:DNA-3-methyladenine glycosylase II